MTVVVAISLAMLGLAAVLCIVAVLRGRTLADRAVGLDAAVATMICGLAAGAVRSGDSLWVDAALILGLLSFLATTTIARYISQRGL